MFGASKPKFDANKTKVNLKMLVNRFNLLTQKKVRQHAGPGCRPDAALAAEAAAMPDPGPGPDPGSDAGLTLRICLTLRRPTSPSSRSARPRRKHARCGRLARP